MPVSACCHPKRWRIKLVSSVAQRLSTTLPQILNPFRSDHFRSITREERKGTRDQKRDKAGPEVLRLFRGRWQGKVGICDSSPATSNLLLPSLSPSFPISPSLITTHQKHLRNIITEESAGIRCSKLKARILYAHSDSNSTKSPKTQRRRVAETHDAGHRSANGHTRTSKGP